MLHFVSACQISLYCHFYLHIKNHTQHNMVGRIDWNRQNVCFKFKVKKGKLGKLRDKWKLATVAEVAILVDLSFFMPCVPGYYREVPARCGESHISAKGTSRQPN